jgi:CRISP-associated protein Cas1
MFKRIHIESCNSTQKYGYAILESEIRKDINVAGLDPTVGFLHELAQTKTPLVYDIQQLFRWLVDLSVLQVLEEKKLKKTDFIVTKNYHLRLKPATAKMLIEKITLNFNGKVKYKHDKQSSYQSILLDSIQQLANFIVGKRKKDLQFVIPTVGIERDDGLEIQQKIMKITPSERKRIGINKSTLWYQKKHLTEAKRIMIYDKIFSKLELAH